MTADHGGTAELSRAAVQIWDSHYGPATRAFDCFRDAVCSAFMPWTPEFSGADFEGRVESLALHNGTVGRVSTSAIVARKSRTDIARSPIESVCLNYVYSGEIHAETGDWDGVARPGDLVLHHSHLPVTLSERPGGRCDNLALVIPLSRIRKTTALERALAHTVIPADRLAPPLRACFDMMARGVSRSSPEEIAALLDACALLLPLSLGQDDETRRDRRGEGEGLAGDVKRFVEQNICDPGLSPRRTAEHFGISTRYVHKLFAASGTTFSRYVATERLERVRSDIVATYGPRTPISEHAFRWGFADLSTFNRAFRRRFGCSPRDCRP
ncbi:AraC family transcriptional regulator [Hansschlegelia zhihuaiae]|uniref:AraC family transcriptional regulator n=1 Tax=Hansschlegelia zhihuaiae TaxID=405005 RepID=A0A4Q0MJX4_9HYPH|nr:AraC family transcriptional regulator [Hansschlegelia zhihuaiae]RXF73286.1 AraC family transcriptional regulator [Hansschlegelia zhihuaiae]